MMILVGDLHGNTERLYRAAKIATQTEATAVIQVGDLGLFAGNRREELFHAACSEYPVPIYFIDGNHDDCRRWTTHTVVTRVWDDANLFYVPRGTVMELDGKRLAFMGGAASIDKEKTLADGYHWDEFENISQNQVDRLYWNVAKRATRIDALITHDIPTSVCEAHFNDNNKVKHGVSKDWKDPNMDIIESIWKTLDYPPLYAGHMHRAVIGNNYRILGIDEFVMLE
jgi:predicted phosphodiesterase